MAGTLWTTSCALAVTYDPLSAAARRWMDHMRPHMQAAPFAYWESFNEMAAWDVMRQYGEFEAERQRLMAAEGFKACIGNFSAGTPPLRDGNLGDSEDMWPHMYPALEVAHDLGNVLGLHEYGPLYMWGWYGDAGAPGSSPAFPNQSRAEGWMFGRYRKIWRIHVEPNNWTNLRVAFTEFGIYGQWKGHEEWGQHYNRHDPEQFYFEQLVWADNEMLLDPHVVGATIFTWGTIGNWDTNEIEGPVAEKLIAYIDNTEWSEHEPDSPNIPPRPTDPDPPPDDPVIYLTAIPAEGLRVREGPGVQHDQIGSVHPGDKLLALDSWAIVRQRLGQNNQWLRIRTPEGIDGYSGAWLLEAFGAQELPDPKTKVYITPIQISGSVLRVGPGDEFDVVAELFMGDLLVLLQPTLTNINLIGDENAWLKVRSPRGQNGWISASIVQRSFAGQSTDPVDTDDGELHLHTTLPEGQRLYSGPSSRDLPITTILPQDRLVAQGDMRLLRSLLGQAGKRVPVVTPSGIFGWADAGTLEVMPLYVTWEGGHALVGLHGPADPGTWPWTEDVYRVIREGRIEAVKVLAAGDLDSRVINRLHQEGVQFIMARLFAKFEHNKSPRDFVGEVRDATIRLFNAGIRYFEVHNEPNLHIPNISPEGMWVAWQNGREFGQFFQETVALLKAITPGVLWGWPGLSPGPAIPGQRMAEEVFLQQADAAIRSADFVCMHTYWGGDGTNYRQSLESVRRYCERFPTQPIFVTEFANTHPGQNEIDKKGTQYVDFYNEAKNLPPNLGGLFGYVLTASSGHPEQHWLGTSIPRTVGRRAV